MNKNVKIVVGASGFIGNSIYSALKEKDSSVVGTASRLNAHKSFMTLDLTNRESIKQFAESIDSVECLIIAAGKEPQYSLDELTEDHLEKMISIHYSGPLWLIKKLKEKFNPGSSIIFCSSVAAFKGSYDPSYSSLKGAINSLVRTLARELAPNVRVNAIAPGLVENSPVYNRMTSDFRDKHRKASLNQTLLSENELTHMLMTMMEQKNLNGQIIHLNGGQYFG
jgi:3-oxoacyl-[acyl-carrier protein] reductase